MFVSESIVHQDRLSHASSQLREISDQFVSKAADKNENFNNVMRCLESLQNHLLAIQSARDELVNSAFLNSIQELMKILPTRDHEFSFLADFFMVLSQILSSATKFAPSTVQNL